MSKKIFTLATTSCGYCKMTKQLMDSKYPDIGDKYIYFLADKNDVTEEAEKVFNFARRFGIKSVPLTVMLENNEVKTAVRGYSPSGLDQLVKALSDEPKVGDQLEIPFDDQNEEE